MNKKSIIKTLMLIMAVVVVSCTSRSLGIFKGLIIGLIIVLILEPLVLKFLKL